MDEEKTLVEQTSEKLIQYINESDFSVGDKLPNEYQLSEKLEVGRSTLREAVRVLTSRNILEVRQGSGTYISDKKGISLDPWGFSLVKNRDQMIRDLFELRYLLEPKMAALAAKNVSESQVERLVELHKKIEQSFVSGTDDHVALDIDFHTKIAEASGNIALVHIIPIINESIALFNKNYNVSHLKIETIDLHAEIVEAISNGDEIGAFDAMTIHMSNNRKEFKKIIKGNKTK